MAYAAGTVIALLGVAVSSALYAAQATPAGDLAVRSTFANASLWDDGLSEMCFYDAEIELYGQARRYTRTHLLNREWFDPTAGVKTDRVGDSTAVAVMKLNIAEEAPTENYNYRYLTTLFAERDSLKPRKLAASSQEWCGNAYQHLRWSETGLHFRSFSYFEGEAEQDQTLPSEVWPFEAAFLLGREYAASGRAPTVARMLAPARRLRGGPIDLGAVVFSRTEPERLSTPAGVVDAVEVTMEAGGVKYRMWFDAATPHLLLKFEFPGERGVLRHHERRAYWDRAWRSGFHEPGQAP